MWVVCRLALDGAVVGDLGVGVVSDLLEWIYFPIRIVFFCSLS